MTASVFLLAATANFLMRFANGGEEMWSNWSSNHLKVRAFATDGTNVLAAAPMSEGGPAVSVLDPDGKFLFACPQAYGTGEREVKAAYGDGRYWIVRDGFFAKPDCWRITLSVHNAATGRVVPFAGGKQFCVLEEISADSPVKLTRLQERIRNFRTDERVLAGCRYLNGELWVETALSGVRIYCAKTGEFLRNGKPWRTDALPKAIAARVCAPYAGKYDPAKLVDPVAWLTDARGNVWVAEDRWNPKRITCWSADGRLLFEKIGSPAYGSPSAGFNGEDATTWVADNVLWEVDADRRTARTKAVTRKRNLRAGGTDPARSYRFCRHGGKQYALGNGFVFTVSEVETDGRFRDCAMLTTIHFFERSLDLEQTELVKAIAARHGVADPQEKRRRGLLWRDRNGDGEMQAEETETTPPGWTLGWGWFGPTAENADLPILLKDAQRREWRGDLRFPDWSFAGAMADLKPISGEYPPGERTLAGNEYAVDDLGNMYVQASSIVAIGRDGAIRWSVPNGFRGVHGSHHAPFPRSGEMQGVLFALGTAPLPDGRRVIAWQGNHGPVYFMDSEGALLASLFKDCRVSELEGADLIGGEPFGGTFGYDRKRNRYLLQGGSGGYRIYEIAGLATARPADAVRQAEFSLPRPESVTVTAKGRAELARWGRTDGEISLSAERRNGKVEFSVRVKDASPWVNNGGDWTSLFKTGDSFNFHFGKERILIAPFEGKIAAVRYRFGGDAVNPVDFRSPWRTVTVPDVRRVEGETNPKVEIFSDGYGLAFSVPEAELRAACGNDGRLKCDFGVIFGDAAGRVNLARVYLFNRSTGLVNDVPGEIEPDCPRYGELEFAEEGTGCGSFPLGPAYDAATATVFMETEPGILTAMDEKGGVRAQYEIGESAHGWPHSALTVHAGRVWWLCGKTLTGVAVGSPSWTKPERADFAPWRISQISSRVRGDEMLAIRAAQKDVIAIDLKRRSVRVVGKGCPDAPVAVEWCDDGGVLFLGRHTERMTPDGRMLSNGWPRKIIGDREMGFRTGTVVDGVAYLSAHNGTVRAFDAGTLEPSPGVVLGGKSGHFIGKAYVHPELTMPGLVQPFAEGVYLIGGEAGSAFVLHRNPNTGRFEIGRRIAPRSDAFRRQPKKGK